MIIKHGQQIRKGDYGPLEILAKEPWFKNPVAIVIARGQCIYDDSRSQFTTERFDDVHTIRDWANENGITKSKKWTAYKAYPFFDAIYDLLTQAHDIHATKAALRSVTYSSRNDEDQTSYTALIYAALYK